MDDPNNTKFIKRDIADDVRTSFLDYAMSVITARALPDARDGLKPVHRRILHSMNELGIVADKPYKKSARIVGDVIGKYHPHGDTAVYDAMVRLAQDFNTRYELVQGHGNFGSIDGDGAAHMRYTEARMSKIAMEMMRDIQKDTVNFQDNYDGEEKEPSVLPAKFPNLLCNGGVGIAVGMATNIPPHNLKETINAALAMIDDPDITVAELMEKHIYGPDFPTGGIILGRSGIKQAFETGRGSIITRSRVTTEELPNGKHRLIVTEIPYAINKATLVERIAALVREKQIEGITDLTDESNRDGIRIVIELRKDVQPDVLLNQLFRLTSLQTSFGVNMMALVNGEPKLLGLKEALQVYIDHQIDVIVRRTKFDLKKAEDRAHILEGLLIALDHIDAIINLIRQSKDDNEAMTGLMENFKLSEIQAKAILEMQLRRLTGLARDKIEGEYNTLLTAIADYKDILANHSRVVEIIKTELTEIRDKYGDERRTEISDSDLDMQDEDLIPIEDIVVTMTTNGYIKRLPVDTYRTQNRGGKGVKGMTTHEDDVVEFMVSMVSHDYLMMFTNLGKVYRIKGYQVPAASRTSKGIPVVNLLDLDKDEKVRAMVPVRPDNDAKYYVFATKNGIVKRTAVEEFDHILKKGKIAIVLGETDELIAVKPTSGDDEILLAASNGKVARFHEDDIRPMGRKSIGVRGMNVDGSALIGMATSIEGTDILSVTEKGYGKKTPISEYRMSKRGAKGVITVNVSEQTGNLVCIRTVKGNEDAMIITNEGVIIRLNLETVSTYGRNTRGVRLINLSDSDAVVSKVTIVYQAEDENVEESIDNSNQECLNKDNN